ncbi:MAG TPA: elongation factor P maturation arginine rhamnosyltransferase EarP [Burkholderiaceae bacterium]|nr:elongation factor P maturation arginine rhamnosyltransferase EarP [Burkholderiaceae bacterium]
MPWDVFCRVVDNLGDIGVCWRLAADLAARGEHVRLWIDDASALRWMAPRGAAGVELRDWAGAEAAEAALEPGAVVIEAFGCALPAAFVRRMAQARPAPVWINLEYLSAEAYVERAHGLPSPQPDGLRKWFFYPGFTERTGGLIREPDLAARQAAFDAPAWLASNGIEVAPGARVVSLFCYDSAPVDALAERLAAAPTRLLVAAGVTGPSRSAAQALPRLTQRDFDHLLWAADLNIVRGEDSFVRAQWAGRPFLWQLYPQHDGAHLAKLEAFLDRFLASAEAPLPAAVRRLWRAWNGAPRAGPLPAVDAWPEPAAWRAHCMQWRTALWAQDDLTTQLYRFAAGTR